MCMSVPQTIESVNAAQRCADGITEILCPAATTVGASSAAHWAVARNTVGAARAKEATAPVTRLRAAIGTARAAKGTARRATTRRADIISFVD